MEWPNIISVDGNIGAGKSTFLEEVAEYYRDDPTVIILKEPVDKWTKLMDPDTNISLLESYYENPITFAFPFQVYILQTLIQAMDATIKANPQCRLLICERSILTSRHVFSRMLHYHEVMNPIEYQIYENMFQMIPHIEKYYPTKIFYLKVDPMLCHDRVQLRNRKGEEDITNDYLDECEEFHQQWLEITEIPYKISHNANNRLQEFLAFVTVFL
jgi:deoxyadenosine/deoxycytidine kinase